MSHTLICEIFFCHEDLKFIYFARLTDPCCLGPKTVSGYLGETVNISCSYPEQFETNIKVFYKWTGEDLKEVINTTVTPIDRFSIYDDTISKVLSVDR